METTPTRTAHALSIPADTRGPRALAVSLPSGGRARLEAGGKPYVCQLTPDEARGMASSGIHALEVTVPDGKRGEETAERVEASPPGETQKKARKEEA